MMQIAGEYKLANVKISKLANGENLNANSAGVAIPQFSLTSSIM